MTKIGSRQSSMVSGAHGPSINATLNAPRLTVCGRGFLPGRAVIIRVIESDEMTSYFQYLADPGGELTATLPTAIPQGALRISATDGRRDPTDETGIWWTDTDTITW
jgi:hypothetical protein